jgi:hypothetical protein
MIDSRGNLNEAKADKIQTMHKIPTKDLTAFCKARGSIDIIPVSHLNVATSQEEGINRVASQGQRPCPTYIRLIKKLGKQLEN